MSDFSKHSKKARIYLNVERTKNMMIDPDTISKRLESLGGALKLDSRFSGGIFHVTLDKRLEQLFSSWDQIKTALINADKTRIEFAENMQQFFLRSPSHNVFHLAVLAYKNTELSSQQVLAALTNTGLKPALLEEMLAGAILSPEWLKPDGMVGRIVALGSPLQLGKDIFQNQYGSNLPDFNCPTNILVPYMGWLAESRLLRSAGWLSEWNEHDRFVCTLDG
jgi:hypothetical protein